MAQDICIYDSRAGEVTAQPAVGQVAFAVFVSFGFAAFVIKKFLDVDYIMSILAGVAITAISVMIYVKQGSFGYLVEQLPTNFFSNTVVAVLPVQMIAFGALGSVAGYWMAFRYNYWRNHEMK